MCVRCDGCIGRTRQRIDILYYINYKVRICIPYLHIAEIDSREKIIYVYVRRPALLQHYLYGFPDKSKTLFVR